MKFSYRLISIWHLFDSFSLKEHFFKIRWDTLSFTKCQMLGDSCSVIMKCNVTQCIINNIWILFLWLLIHNQQPTNTILPHSKGTFPYSRKHQHVTNKPVHPQPELASGMTLLATVLNKWFTFSGECLTRHTNTHIISLRPAYKRLKQAPMRKACRLLQIQQTTLYVCFFCLLIQLTKP